MTKITGRTTPIASGIKTFVGLVHYLYLTLLPQVRAATGGPRWRASRESNPSEDLSELPPLLKAVAGQEYHY